MIQNIFKNKIPYFLIKIYDTPPHCDKKKGQKVLAA